MPDLDMTRMPGPMSDRPAFITDYIAAYLAANPSRPEPTIKGPLPGGGCIILVGTPPIYVTTVRRDGLIEMTARLRARVGSAQHPTRRYTICEGTKVLEDTGER